MAHLTIFSEDDMNAALQYDLPIVNVFIISQIALYNLKEFYEQPPKNMLQWAVRLQVNMSILTFWPSDKYDRSLAYNYLRRQFLHMWFRHTTASERLEFASAHFKELDNNDRIDPSYLTTEDLVWLLQRRINKKRSVAIKTIRLYRVHFTEALDLIRSREVLLKRGYAIVESEDMHHVLGQKLVSNLKAKYDKKSVPISSMSKDQFQLHLIVKRSVNIEMDPSMDAAKARMPDALCPDIEDFPSCLQRMVALLERDGHLKNSERCLFYPTFAHAGVPLEYTVDFFKKYWLKKGNPEKGFEEYENNIKYNYGVSGGGNRALIANKTMRKETQCRFNPMCPYHGNSSECSGVAKALDLIDAESEIHQKPSEYLKIREIRKRDHRQGDLKSCDSAPPSTANLPCNSNE